MDNSLTYVSLGGVGNVTKNMHLYQYKDEILIVDCGLGFADQSMPGVDLLLPDITYLKNTNKKIIGMVITHGHEDHLGALPFVLPDLPSFPIYATPLTAEFANTKLKEFGSDRRVQKVDFGGGEIKLGNFIIDFIRVTHSVPDSANIFIKTPIGNFYHGSDFKFDLTPFDGKKTDFKKITRLSNQGVICLLSDSLGSEKAGHTASEMTLSGIFEKEIEKCKGKFIVTTYSSNLSRINQVIKEAKIFGRKICFVGRSVIKAKEIGENIGYLQIDKSMEVTMDNLRNYKDSQLVLIVAGSQGQESSALTRIVTGEHRDIKLNPQDVVVFSSDPIPGNEISINSLIDAIVKTGAKALYTELADDFHVSGHASSQDLMMMMNLVNAKYLIPIGGTYKQMYAYKNLAKMQGYQDQNILLLDSPQEIIFSNDNVILGKKIETRNIFVDQISGEEVDSFILRDRKKIATGGVVIILAEVDSENGQMIENPNIVIRGMSVQEAKDIEKNLSKKLKESLSQKKPNIKDWIYMRKFIAEVAEKTIFKLLRKRPLIIPVVIEV